MERLKLLKQLYQQRLFGYSYFDDIKPTKNFSQTASTLHSLDELKKEVFSCHLCELVKSKKNYVFGEGDENASLMFVGEAPGAYEDELGKPFVGRAGELLTRIINTVLELDRSEVYIANIVKCRPPNNATPSQEIADSCKEYLFKQIEFIKPKIIVALGATAYKYLTNDLDAKITRVRGSVIEWGGIKLIPTYHPSYLLRNPSAKKDVFVDMKKVKAML
jgi:DNA polymerase